MRLRVSLAQHGIVASDAAIARWRSRAVRQVRCAARRRIDGGRLRYRRSFADIADRLARIDAPNLLTTATIRRSAMSIATAESNGTRPVQPGIASRPRPAAKLIDYVAGLFYFDQRSDRLYRPAGAARMDRSGIEWQCHSALVPAAPPGTIFDGSLTQPRPFA